MFCAHILVTSNGLNQSEKRNGKTTTDNNFRLFVRHKRLIVKIQFICPFQKLASDRKTFGCKKKTFYRIRFNDFLNQENVPSFLPSNQDPIL